MAERQTTARKQSRAKRKDERPRAKRAAKAKKDTGLAAGTADEQELASYLEERIKPGLNRGSIPMLARSIAREIAHEQYRDGDDADGDDAQGDLEGQLHALQRRLGNDWTLYLAVHGDDSWLAAEKDDVSQRVEAQDAGVLVEAVRLLSGSGGRSRQRDDDD